MPNDTFVYDDVTISIRAKKGRDDLDSPWILHDLVEMIKEERKIDTDDLPNLEWGRLSWFVEIFLRSEVTGDLGFHWPNIETSTNQELYEAYKNLMDSPGDLVKFWKKASRRSNLEFTSPEE